MRTLRHAAALAWGLRLVPQLAPAGALVTPRGVEELKLMTARELAFEAAQACAEANIAQHASDELTRLGALQEALERYHTHRLAREYLGRIGLVVRDKLGREPAWLIKLAQESGRASYQHHCVEIASAAFPQPPSKAPGARR